LKVVKDQRERLGETRQIGHEGVGEVGRRRQLGRPKQMRDARAHHGDGGTESGEDVPEEPIRLAVLLIEREPH
jgi:hypothetical protein